MTNRFTGDDEQDKYTFINPASLSSPLISKPLSELETIINGTSASIVNPLSELSGSINGMLANNVSPILDSFKSTMEPINSISQSLSQQGIFRNIVPNGPIIAGRLGSYNDNNDSVVLGTNYVESDSEREAREDHEEREEIKKRLQDLQNQIDTKEEQNDAMIELGAITALMAKRDEKNEPETMLARLPNQLSELAKHCRVAELDLLAGYFSRTFFYWNCGFGHPVEKIRTLPQLKQIIEEQKKGEPRRCNHGHPSILLVTNNLLFTVSVDDFKGGKIRGGTNKSDAKPGVRS